MKQLKPEEVVQKYRERGWRPARHIWINSDARCACGIGVIGGLDFEKRIHEKNRNFTIVALAVAMLGLDRRYAIGFISGFDGDDGDPDEGEAFELGYKDGRASWEACVREGLAQDD